MQIEFLKESIKSHVSLTDDEWNTIVGYFHEQKISKNKFFLNEGDICNSIAFINTGTLIYFKLTAQGNEITTDFAFSGDWVTDNRSRLQNCPSLINIKAIENTELLVITNKNLLQCFDQIPKLEKIGRILIEQALVKITQQSIDLQTLTASERYDKMLREYPEIFQKVPLYHIANYLGVAPKSLSRIRQQKVKR